MQLDGILALDMRDVHAIYGGNYSGVAAWDAASGGVAEGHSATTASAGVAQCFPTGTRGETTSRAQTTRLLQGEDENTHPPHSLVFKEGLHRGGEDGDNGTMTSDLSTTMSSEPETVSGIIPNGLSASTKAFSCSPSRPLGPG